MKNNPQCNFNTSGLTKSVVQCASKSSVVNCVVKPAVKATLDPCFQQHMAHQVTSDPYYQHMPHNDAAAATIYAARMGGENHEMAKCEIM